jgi:hypothetical protein
METKAPVIGALADVTTLPVTAPCDCAVSEAVNTTFIDAAAINAAIGAMRRKLEWTDMVPLDPSGVEHVAQRDWGCESEPRETGRKRRSCRLQLRAGGTSWWSVAEWKEEMRGN